MESYLGRIHSNILFIIAKYLCFIDLIRLSQVNKHLYQLLIKDADIIWQNVQTEKSHTTLNFELTSASSYLNNIAGQLSSVFDLGIQTVPLGPNLCRHMLIKLFNIVHKRLYSCSFVSINWIALLESYPNLFDDFHKAGFGNISFIADRFKSILNSPTHIRELLNCLHICFYELEGRLVAIDTVTIKYNGSKIRYYSGAYMIDVQVPNKMLTVYRTLDDVKNDAQKNEENFTKDGLNNIITFLKLLFNE